MHIQMFHFCRKFIAEETKFCLDICAFRLITLKSYSFRTQVTHHTQIDVSNISKLVNLSLNFLFVSTCTLICGVHVFNVRCPII